MLRSEAGERADSPFIVVGEDRQSPINSRLMTPASPAGRLGSPAGVSDFGKARVAAPCGAAAAAALEAEAAELIDQDLYEIILDLENQIRMQEHSRAIQAAELFGALADGTSDLFPPAALAAKTASTAIKLTKEAWIILGKQRIQDDIRDGTHGNNSLEYLQQLIKTLEHVGGLNEEFIFNPAMTQLIHKAFLSAAALPGSTIEERRKLNKDILVMLYDDSDQPHTALTNIVEQIKQFRQGTMECTPPIGGTRSPTSRKYAQDGLDIEGKQLVVLYMQATAAITNIQADSDKKKLQSRALKALQGLIPCYNAASTIVARSQDQGDRVNAQVVPHETIIRDIIKKIDQLAPTGCSKLTGQKQPWDAIKYELESLLPPPYEQRASSDSTTGGCIKFLCARMRALVTSDTSLHKTGEPEHPITVASNVQL
jgi:hypothetical protein